MVESAEQTEQAEQTGTEIAAFSEIESQLGELKQFDAERDFDYRSKDGNKAARSHVYQLRRTKTAIENARKAHKKPYIDYLKRVDDEAKRLTGEIERLITPHQAQIEAIEREEKEREERLQAGVQRIRDWASAEPDADSDRLRELLHEAEAFIVDEEAWGDYAAPAEAAREKAASMLRMRLEKVEAEEAERARIEAERERERKEREQERAELEQLRREKAEREAREQAEAEEAAAAQAASDQAEALESDEPAAESVEGDGEALPDADQGEKAAPGVDEHRERREKMRAEAIEAVRKVEGIGPAKACAVVDAIAAGHIPHIRFDGQGGH